jgi:DNA (cytosine-5)-methyltransferase 1
MLTFGELFAGIGGFSLGLERAGMKCKWQVEIDPYATAVLKKHWPEVPKHDDVRTFPPQGDYAVDLICGGFPCQDISVAGKGAGLAGARSGLWYEFARIIGVVRPRYVVVENVSALLTRGMDAVLRTLSTLGYDAEWHVVPASAVGAPHRRERVWIVGIRRWHCSKADASCSNADGLGSHREEIDIDCGSREEPDVPDANRAGRQQQRRPEPVPAEQLAAQCGGWWESEPDVGRVAHGVPSRVDRLRCLGNAVVPQVVEVIGRAIIAHEERLNK